MNEVNKTLYIPLYGKALVSKKGIILPDPKAEEVWEGEGFPLKGRSRSKWLAYYMGMRARVFDRWLQAQLQRWEDAAVLHIGCGMDSRILRVGNSGHLWFEVDFPEVIAQREKHYAAQEGYRMLPGDARRPDFLEQIPGTSVIVALEGISMYLTDEELRGFLSALDARFDRVAVLTDCYTAFAARMSKYKNPVNDVGVTKLYGIDDPKLLESGNIRFLAEHSITPDDLISQLQGMEMKIFRKLYAGKMAKKLYRLYEFHKE